MNANMMTLEEFRATRTFEADLASRFGIASGTVSKTAYVYADECYVEITDNNPHGKYYLTLNSCDWWISDNLEEMETHLYEGWYVHEHKCEGV